MPTAPEILPTATTSRARRTRSRSRCSSAYHSASLRPNVIGSACTPWVRPIIGVRRCSSARSATAAISAGEVLDDQVAGLAHLDAPAPCRRRRRRSGRSAASAPPGPTCSATAVVNAMTSCCVICSISSMRAMSNAGLVAQLARGIGRHDAGLGHGVGGRELDVEPGLVAALLAPDARPFRGWCSAGSCVSDRPMQSGGSRCLTQRHGAVRDRSAAHPDRASRSAAGMLGPSTVAASDPLREQLARDALHVLGS